MLSRFYAAEGISFKKTVRASEQDRPDVAERRQAWRREQKNLVGRLIFLDETWTTTAMIHGISASGLAHLLGRFPGLRKLMTGQEVGIEQLMAMGGEAVAAIIAAPLRKISVSESVKVPG
jgi:hypothetical protein